MTTKGKNPSTIIYPETDGMPLPDGEFQAPLYRDVVSTLETHFRNVPGAWVNGNTFIYYREGEPRYWVSPDCYVALDIDPSSIERFNTYRVWEVGKPPDFVLEIGSPSTAANDLVHKRDLYAQLGISEYWRYDSTGGNFYGEPLAGEGLADGQYRPFELHHEADGMIWAHSPALGLDLCWHEGQLRFYHPEQARWLLTQQETEDARLAAEDARRAERQGWSRGTSGRVGSRTAPPPRPITITRSHPPSRKSPQSPPPSSTPSGPP